MRHGAAERLYHPLGERDTATGIALLRQMALDIPVYRVRLEGGYIKRTLQQVRADLISEAGLVEGVTGYAAAFVANGERVLVTVSRAPLRRPEPVVWRQREHAPSEGPVPTPPPLPAPESPPRGKKRRNKGNPETRKAAKKKARQKRRQEQ
ncbi:hypothetical protein [Deinococcus sp. Leaf326]|uniref:hypothetical protein n=1 Tax=Deinococcus sp. Leaf326 TaxID=1736338 RepID=UPI000ACB3070|nr:hypothetical protein [Deinococcus sp. Leaf326]